MIILNVSISLHFFITYRKILSLKVILGEMIFEMKLIEFSNPSNTTYTNKPCGLASNSVQCETGFLFCLVDLPFRNPQNCSLGDYTTPILGGNRIRFKPNATQNFTYKFLIKNLPLVS